MLKYLFIFGMVFVLAMGVASLYTNQFDVFIEFLKLCVNTGKEIATWVIEKGIPIFLDAVQKMWALIAELVKSYGG